MVQKRHNDGVFSNLRSQRLFHSIKAPSIVFSGQSVHIYLNRLLAKWPTKNALQRSPKRYKAITDQPREDYIHCRLHTGHIKKAERIFPVSRSTVNRHVHTLAERAGGAPFVISADTTRHSYANDLLTVGGRVF